MATHEQPRTGKATVAAGWPVRVLTVDDQPPFRDAARMVVDATPGFAWAGEVTSGAEAVEAVTERELDLIVMDVRMPDMDGIAASALVRRARPGVAVLLVSSDPLACPVADLLRSGAIGFAAKRNFRPALLRALRARLIAPAAPLRRAPGPLSPDLEPTRP
jgi:DNA-binding NarL/FixJ family response regulator